MPESIGFGAGAGGRGVGGGRVSGGLGNFQHEEPELRRCGGAAPGVRGGDRRPPGGPLSPWLRLLRHFLPLRGPPLP